MTHAHHLLKEKTTHFDKEHSWKILFENQPFDDKRFRKVCSDLLKLFEKFLIQQGFEKNPLHQANYLIEEVSNRKQEGLYNTTMNSARRLSSRELNRSASFYYYQYQVEKNYYQLSDFDAKRGDRSNVEEITNNLDRFYLAEKLKYYCNLLSRQKIIAHDYEFLFLDEIVSHIKKYEFNEIPPISIYYHIYLTLVDIDNEENINNLKKLMDEHITKFPPKEAIDIYYSAINYWTKKLNLGHSNALGNMFELYKEGLEKKILLIDNEIDPWTFKNIVVVGLRFKKLDWVEEFINTYKDKILIEYRENSTTYNSATLYFYKKDYGKVVDFLQSVEYEDINYNLGAKSMLLATYYETDEIEALDSLISSFRIFLNRNKKIPDSRRIEYSNLFKYTKKLSRLLPKDKSSLEKIKQEIIDTTRIASKRWLLEKVAELE